MKNWKTTVAGFLGGLIITFGPSVGARLSGEPTAPPITAQNYLPGLGLAVLSAFAKDHDLSGGERKQ